VGPSRLFGVINILLVGKGLESVHVAMQCLKNIFENIEPHPKIRFFDDLRRVGIIDLVIQQLDSPCNLPESLSNRFTLARHICSISASPDIVDAVVSGLKEHIINTIQTMEWQDIPSALWDFILALRNEATEIVHECCSFVTGAICERVSSFGDFVLAHMNQMYQMAELFGTTAAKFVSPSLLHESPLLDAIVAFLRSDRSEAVDVAMHCVANLLENIESDAETPFFADLGEAGIIDLVIQQLDSPCNLPESLSNRFTLARHICSISRSAPIADAAITHLRIPLMQHLETIDWTHSPPELWHFVNELPYGCSPAIDGFRSSLVASLLNTLTAIGFAAHSLVPACDPVISIIDSACESDSDLVGLCLDLDIPAVMMQHFLTTTSDDSACACLQLLANFVRSAPDRSPLYPEFVDYVSRSLAWFLDDVIHLAWLTYQACPRPRPWFEFAELVVGSCANPLFEMAPQAKAFYASCFSHGLLQDRPNDLSDVGNLVPMFCDLLPLTHCHQESILELMLRYFTHPDAPGSPDCFACALEAIRRGDLPIAEMAAAGSARARGLLEYLSTL
jgi:hypothetical protein